jgi:UDP-glucose 4-epimerase
MKKVLVTGGAGYIGSHTVVELVNAGYEPIIFDNFVNSSPNVINQIEEITGTKIRYYNVDVANSEQFNLWTAEFGDIEAIIHFAAYKSVPASVVNPSSYYKNNLNGMINVLWFAGREGIPVIFSSSCSVYGEPDESRVDETMRLNPAQSPYANTKKICEDMLSDACNAYDISGVSLRYFNPIGAHPSIKIGESPVGLPGNLVPRLNNAIIEGRPITIYGTDYPTPDGTCIRDYIYVVDLAKAHVLAIDYVLKNDPIYEVFNVGTGKGTSVLELVTSFERATGNSFVLQTEPRRAGDVTEVYADPTKIKKKLGWDIEYDLDTALITSYKWAVKHHNHLLSQDI